MNTWHFREHIRMKFRLEENWKCSLPQWLLHSYFNRNTKIAGKISTKGRCQILHKLRRIQKSTSKARWHCPILRTTAIQIHTVHIRVYHFGWRQILHCVFGCKLCYDRCVFQICGKFVMSGFQTLAKRVRHYHWGIAEICAVHSNQTAKF